MIISIHYSSSWVLVFNIIIVVTANICVMLYFAPNTFCWTHCEVEFIICILLVKKLRFIEVYNLSKVSKPISSKWGFGIWIFLAPTSMPFPSCHVLFSCTWRRKWASCLFQRHHKWRWYWTKSWSLIPLLSMLHCHLYFIPARFYQISCFASKALVSLSFFKEERSWTLTFPTHNVDKYSE